MNFECLECKKNFHYAAKQTERYPENPGETISNRTCAIDIEKAVCPYCLSLNITEAQPQAISPEEIEAVYIYDLTSGAQTQLDKLLAQGYRIVSRYAKQYHLEKTKAKEVVTNDT